MRNVIRELLQDDMCIVIGSDEEKMSFAAQCKAENLLFIDRTEVSDSVYPYPYGIMLHPFAVSPLVVYPHAESAVLGVTSSVEEQARTVSWKEVFEKNNNNVGYVFQY